MGFDIGFLYQKDMKFEEGLRRFRVDWPGLQAEFEMFLRQTRAEWQNEFSEFRNRLVEHQAGKICWRKRECASKKILWRIAQ